MSMRNETSFVAGCAETTLLADPQQDLFGDSIKRGFAASRILSAGLSFDAMWKVIGVESHWFPRRTAMKSGFVHWGHLGHLGHRNTGTPDDKVAADPTDTVEEKGVIGNHRARAPQKNRPGDPDHQGRARHRRHRPG